jgi:MFS family permease
MSVPASARRTSLLTHIQIKTASVDRSSSTGTALAFGIMCVGCFIAYLDIQIVSGSVEQIGGGLSASQDELSWIQTSYLIAEIVVIPLSGWLSRVMSTRWLIAASAGGFTVASILCTNSAILFIVSDLAWNGLRTKFRNDPITTQTYRTPVVRVAMTFAASVSACGLRLA